MTSFTSPCHTGIFISTSVNDTSSPHARQHLRSSLHLTNPCAKQKVLSLTKLKGRIYKTKSLGHYIKQRGPGRDISEGVLCIPQSSSISRTSPLDCLMSYLGLSLGWSAEVMSVYYTAPADWAVGFWNTNRSRNIGQVSTSNGRKQQK